MDCIGPEGDTLRDDDGLPKLGKEGNGLTSRGDGGPVLVLVNDDPA
jgi:hypothetical protein